MSVMPFWKNKNAVHDIEVDHRIYEDCDGTELLDICLVNFADTKDRFKLTCSVYVDGSDQPCHIDLPYYSQAVAGRATHTFTLRLDSLVPNPEAHRQARVVVSAVNRDESVYVNNEFTVYLGGGIPLYFEKQPEDATVQEGEDVAFEVAVGGGRPPYTYQWQIWDEKHQRWADLPGFTDPALSRADVGRGGRSSASRSPSPCGTGCPPATTPACRCIWRWPPSRLRCFGGRGGGRGHRGYPLAVKVGGSEINKRLQRYLWGLSQNE